MSYHNCSVWPHDNALLAAGFAQYGMRDAVLRLLTGLFDASLFMDLHRLPELFCGFERRSGEGPTLYPVACNPQTWAACAVFGVLQACLGLSVHGRHGRLVLRRPVLPHYMDELRIRNLRVGEAAVDLVIERHEHDVGVQVTRRVGSLDVVVVK
jgi:glycogen debranching enzyme